MAEKQTILLTGGSGFIGTNMVRLLVESGNYRVVNLDALTYAANPISLDDLNGNPSYEFVNGDITDRELVSSVFAKYHPAGVMHLAAKSHVDRSIVSAEDFVQTNVVGTFTMLEAARRIGMVCLSKRRSPSVFCMSPQMRCLVRLDPMDIFQRRRLYAPNSPYSASKASSDHFVRAYYHTYGLPTVITNCSNNYGPTNSLRS